MLSPEVMMWAKNYYYTSVNRDVSYDNKLTNPEQEKFITSAYTISFINPMKLLLFGTEEADSLTSADIANGMEQLKKTKIYNPLHVLGKLADISVNGQKTLTMSEAAEEFLKYYKTAFLLGKGCSEPFVAYYDPKSKEYVGFDSREFFLVARTSNPGSMLHIDGIIRTSPLKLNDTCVAALRNMVKHNYINSETLPKVSYCVPVGDGKFETRDVNAADPAFPPYLLRKLISCLPPATLAEHETPYHAAYWFAKESGKDYDRELALLKGILNVKDDEKTVEQKNVGVPEKPEESEVLNDVNVFKYLEMKYGLPQDVIIEKITTPDIRTLYTSAYFLGEESKDMSAEEFMEYAAENSENCCGTLDELLRAVCRAEGFDTERSVEDLIRYINDEPMSTQKTLREQVQDYMQEEPIDPETTLQDFVKGIATLTKEPERIAIDFIRACPYIPKGIIAELCNSISNEVMMPETYSLSKLEALGVSSEMVTAIAIADKTGTKFVEPEHIFTEEDMTTYLVRSGYNRATATSLVETLLSNPSSDKVNAYLVENQEPDPVVKRTTITEEEIREYLYSLGIPKLSAEIIMSGKLPRDILDEPGYVVAESLLRDMRRDLSTHDSDELRTQMLPVIYAFMSVLMMKTENKDEVREYLKEEAAKCSPTAASYINTALGKLE